MSRASSVVDIADAIGRAVVEQARPRARAAPIQVRCAAAVTGNGVAVSGPSTRARCAWLVKHRIGVLPPTPRGSAPTMSNRSRIFLGTAGGTVAEKAKSRAESPGPPGLTNTVPRRCRGSLAGIRSRAIRIFAPSGWR